MRPTPKHKTKLAHELAQAAGRLESVRDFMRGGHALARPYPEILDEILQKILAVAGEMEKVEMRVKSIDQVDQWPAADLF